MILILGSFDDSHVCAVASHLDDMGERYAVLYPGDVPTESTVTLDFGTSLSSATSICFDTSTQRIRLADVTSVWCRRLGSPAISTEIVEAGYRDFAAKETKETLEGVWSLTRNKPWMNQRAKDTAASCKPYQLQTAREVGLTIPETIISNNVEECQAFINRVSGRVIYKPLSAFSLTPENEPNKCVYTTIMDRDAVQSRLSQIVYAPCVFQQYIEKTLELRITIVGDSIFAAAIYSQATEGTAVDWRRYDLAHTPHEAYILPESVSRQLLTLMKRLGLVYGAIDMVLSTTGECVFLEINPGGQWLWIEVLTGLPISAAIANTLVQIAK